MNARTSKGWIALLAASAILAGAVGCGDDSSNSSAVAGTAGVSGSPPQVGIGGESRDGQGGTGDNPASGGSGGVDGSGGSSVGGTGGGEAGGSGGADPAGGVGGTVTGGAGGLLTGGAGGALTGGAGGALTGGLGGTDTGGLGGTPTGGTGGTPTGGTGGSPSGGSGGSLTGGTGGTAGSGVGGGPAGGSAGTPSGGSAGVGGEAGSPGSGGSTGGSSSTYDYGYQPTTVTAADVTAAYEYWKANHLEDCGSGVYRVRWDNPDQTVSEGIGYGMLMAVSLNDQTVFDGLWAYYQDNLDPNGLMHWQRAGCDGTPVDQNSNNAATDADLDAAMALLMADCRWGGATYRNDALTLIQAILDHETSTSGGLNLLNPGDVFGGADCQNASYYAPAYYRVFAQVVSSPTDVAFWNKLADDSYALIDVMDHDTTGLVPNWADMNGDTAPSGPSGCSWYDEAHIFGADANRAPWRIAVDYLWWGTAEADAWLDKITDWVLTQGIENVGRKYELDGTPWSTFDHSVISIGAFANAAMAYDQATADAFGAELASVDDHGYFPDSLRVLYMLVAAGQFTTCGGL